MKILSQRDPQWSNLKLGASPLTVGRYGCTTTCLAMLSDYFGGYLTPAQIAARADWYTRDGLVLWAKMSFPTMKFEKRLYGRNDAEIMASLEDPNKACIIEVQGKHWVVCLGKQLLGKGYRIADPWLGDKSNTDRYKNQITGSSHFIRK